MYDIFRDAPLGQCIRLLTGGKYPKYREEYEDFVFTEVNPIQSSSSTRYSTFPSSTDEEAQPEDNRASLQQQHKSQSNSDNQMHLCTWYTDDDEENPQNWSPGKKAWVSAVLFAYSFSVYIGASLYTASVPDIMRIFRVSDVVAALGLTTFVLGYGIGPMLLSPLSEIPVIGRSTIYIITYTLFFLLCIPMVLVDNFAGILVLRFLLGFLGAPSLATCAASYGDFSSATQMPYVIAFWAGGATLAPCLGPLVGNFAVQKMGWRWSSWELLWFCGPICLFMFLSLPETNSDTILLRRARRIRRQTGRTDIRSASELRQVNMSASHIAFDALIKPWQINALDPAVLFTTLYTGLTYDVYYSFFESFPLVYVDEYGFNQEELGLCYLSTFVGLSVAVALLCSYFYFVMPGQLRKYDPVPPEKRMWPGLFAAYMIPVGLFLFAFAARKSVHWIASLVGVAISMCGIFIVTQAIFIYLPFTYPRYSGSIFAANSLSRSIFAASAVLFSLPMFRSIGIAGGVSLLAGLSVVFIFGMHAIWFFGKNLRERSRFAGE